MHDPAFPQWMKEVQAMPAEEQIEAVSKKLTELNPGFDGKHTYKGGGRIVSHFDFCSDHVMDLTPVRCLVGLKDLQCSGSQVTKGILSDLSPLQGMQLTSLKCNLTNVSDLSPLEGLPLVTLDISQTRISDLSPLRSMPSLGRLICQGTPLTNLSPLQGMTLWALDIHSTRVSDVSPLLECKSLKSVDLIKTKVTPAQVAALQKALPNCKIEWDDPAKATPQPAASGTK